MGSNINTHNNESTALKTSFCNVSTLLMVYLAEKACDVIFALYHHEFPCKSLKERLEGQSWQTSPQQKDVSNLKMFMSCWLHGLIKPWGDTQYRAVLLCRRGCSAAVQPCPHSLPWDISLGNSYCTLVMLAPLDRPIGLGSIWVWSVDPRKIQQPMRRQLMGILIKSTAYDALGMQWHFLPTALVIVHETNLLGVSLAVCSKIYCLWLLQSLSLLMNMSLECFHDRKVM